MQANDLLPVLQARQRQLHTHCAAQVKDIARFRPDIKLLISSATLDAQKFSDYFDSAPIFNIPGRRYPVDILYSKAPEASTPLLAMLCRALSLH